MAPSTQVGGASRDRTDDPLLAKQVLSQLSYGPVANATVTDDEDRTVALRAARSASLFWIAGVLCGRPMKRVVILERR